MGNSSIISAHDLQSLLNGAEKDSIRILDATFVLPTSPINPKEEFAQKHIERSQFFDIKDFADPKSSLPHMLCNPEDFEKKISQLGISNDDFIIIYGQSGMIMGPARAWWTFRIFGHENVAVLDGGLPAWEQAKLPTTNEQTPDPDPSHYKASFNPELVRSIEDVKQALDKDVIILDARPADRFSGESPEPREGMRAGHIPGSHSAPCSTLVNQEAGCLKPAEELEQFFQNSGFQANQETILSCGSGVTACALALALHHLGYKNWSVYDGSWSEWGLESSNMPVETAI